MKKTLALFLALAMVFALCAVSYADEEEYQFPEGAELTIWADGIKYDPEVGISSNADILAWQVIEEKTGVHINWIEPAYGTEKEALSILLNSGDYPDIFITTIDNFNAVGGLESAVEQEIIVDLTDLIDKYMPEYNEIRMTSEDVQRLTETATGKVAMLIGIADPNQGPWQGYVVRQDWLDELGMDTPVTYDDWHDMLVAFKEHYGATSALWLNNRGTDNKGLFSAGFGFYGIGATASEGFYKVDDTVHYCAVEDSYKEYLTMLAQWYSEGLIDPDYYTSTLVRGEKDMSLIASGKVASLASTVSYFPNYEANTGVEGLKFTAVPYPVKEEGQELHVRQYNNPTLDAGYAISTSCEDVELACRWLNYLCSEEGSDILNYGKEGETFEYVDGEPRFKEELMNGELTNYQVRNKYATNRAPRYDWTREDYNDIAMEAMEHTWLDNNDGSYYLVAKSLTAEEGDEWAAIMADVDTAVAEWTTKFITGQKSIDAEWDTYIRIIKDMGVERAIEIYQTGYDRYLTLPVK